MAAEKGWREDGDRSGRHGMTSESSSLSTTQVPSDSLLCRLVESASLSRPDHRPDSDDRS